MKSASWAVQKTSGNPPASGQGSASGTASAWDSSTRATVAWAPPPTTAMTRSPGPNSVTCRPTATTSPAISMPGMSCGHPGGAGYVPARCTRSAPLRPAARTATRSSVSPQTGSSRSSQDSRPSRITTACTPATLRGHPPWAPAGAGGR